MLLIHVYNLLELWLKKNNFYPAHGGKLRNIIGIDGGYSVSQQGVWVSFVHANPQNDPSGHPEDFVRNFLKCHFQAIYNEFFSPQCDSCDIPQRSNA